jgi:hypothetical protein
MHTDARQKALDAIAARQTREEANWRAQNVGKIRFYLIGAADDPPTFSVAFQDDLRPFLDALRRNDPDAQLGFMALDSADTVSGYTGEIVIPIIKAASPSLVAVFVGWLTAKAGRKVRLRDGDLEVEAPTVEEVERLLEMAAKHRATQED